MLRSSAAAHVSGIYPGEAHNKGAPMRVPSSEQLKSGSIRHCFSAPVRCCSSFQSATTCLSIITNVSAAGEELQLATDGIKSVLEMCHIWQSGEWQVHCGFGMQARCNIWLRKC